MRGPLQEHVGLVAPDLPTVITLRAHHRRFVPDSSFGMVTRPHADDRGIWVQLSTPPENVLSVERPDNIFAPPSPLSCMEMSDRSEADRSSSCIA